MPDKFVQALAEVLEKAPGTIQMSDRFREYEEWDSLAVLSLIAVVDEQYGVLLSRTDLEQCATVEDLQRRVASKKP